MSTAAATWFEFETDLRDAVPVSSGSSGLGGDDAGAAKAKATATMTAAGTENNNIGNSNTKQQSKPSAVLAMAWSSTGAAALQPILAVSTFHCVHLYLEEGERLEPDASIGRHQGEARALAWHPTQHALAIGYQSGCFTLWTAKKAIGHYAALKPQQQSQAALDPQHQTIGELHEIDQVHTAPITLVQWNPTGTRVVTGDKAGVVGIWSLTNGGGTAVGGVGQTRLTLVHKFARTSCGTVSHCEFRTKTAPSVSTPRALSGRGKSHIRTPSLARNPCPPFFFSGSRGVVYFADDAGHCTEVINVGAGIKIMHYVQGDGGEHNNASLGGHGQMRGATNSNRLTRRQQTQQAARAVSGMSPLPGHMPSYLILVTARLVLFRYTMQPDGTLKLARKVKLSVQGDGASLACTWAGSGLLAAANRESMVRLWHMEQDANYVLSVREPIHGCAPKDVVTSLAFNMHKRTLVAGTQHGRILMWRFVGVAPQDAAKQVSSFEATPQSRTRRLLEDRESGSSSRTSASSTTSKLFNTAVNTAARAHHTPSGADWRALPGFAARHAPITSVVWGPGTELLSVACGPNAVSVFREAVLHAASNGPTCVVQVTSDQLCLQTAEDRRKTIHMGIHVKGLFLSSHHLLAWSGKKCEVREISKTGHSLKAMFMTDTRAMAAYKTSLFVARSDRIDVCNLQGATKHTLRCTEEEGTPLFLDSRSHYLATVTSTSLLKIWNIERATEPNLIVPGYHLAQLGDGHIKSIRINTDGTKVSMIVTRTFGGIQVPDTRLWVYDVERDIVMTRDFGPDFYPVIHCWDAEEAILMAVESHRVDGCMEIENDNSLVDVPAVSAQNAAKQSGSDTGGSSSMRGEGGRVADREVATLFVTSDFGIRRQDSFPIHHPGQRLVGFSVPYLYLFRRPVTDISGVASMGLGGTGVQDHSATLSPTQAVQIIKHTMRDFETLETIDADTKRDILSFSYNLSCGNMDEAYRAVKKIGSGSIWESMAKMCVKTRRMDVAEICLSNMGKARGVRMLRSALKEPESEAQIAMVAIQLGMNEEAERLYKECGRWDLLVNLYQACGRWGKAIEMSAKHDRIGLKRVHYQYARHLESIGDVGEAVLQYERSGTHRNEVPRMLFEADRLEDLRVYCTNSDDPKLYSWWAQYCESNADYQEALKYYDMAKDVLSIVRLYCFREDTRAAMQLCTDPDSAYGEAMLQAASFHLARQLEAKQDFKNALAFYKRARRLNHAMRLARETSMDSDLMQLALESSKPLKAQAAAYFEERGDMKKAVLLYHKAGRVQRAVELCFQAQLFDALREIAADLSKSPGVDPALLNRVAGFFLQNSQYDKAVQVLVAAGKTQEALDLCVEKRVKLTEELVEQMTPPKPQKGAPGEGEVKRRRAEVCTKLGLLCKEQGLFNLACKKYTQAGDKITAIKCLLKSNDKKKIMYYATMTKKREVYVLAANYLQNLDWHSDPQLMHTIVTFYMKARAVSQLASFYDSCAQVEIDEFRDYDKALVALRESVKYVIKSKASAEKEVRLSKVSARIRLIERFVAARALIQTDPDEMVKRCNELLEAPGMGEAVRLGDIYALLIEFFAAQKKWHDAYATVKRVSKAGITLDSYVDDHLLQTIHAKVGKPVPGLLAPPVGGAGHEIGGMAGNGGEVDVDGNDSFGHFDVDEEIPEEAFQ